MSAALIGDASVNHPARDEATSLYLPPGGKTEPPASVRSLFGPADRGALALSALVLAGVFGLDLLTPVELGIPLLYGGALAACWNLPRHSAEFVAAIATGLTAVASVADGLNSVGLAERVLCLAALWTGALLVEHSRMLRDDLAGIGAEAERVARRKQRFLSTAGHDLRHPIQAALLFQDLLARRLHGTADEELATNLGLSLTHAYRVNAHTH
ncbi:MAG: hypothetical protein WCF85_20855 [Rhodospirillaceae bacterium]